MIVQTDVPKFLPANRGNGVQKRLNPEFVKLWESYLDEGMSAKGVAELFGVAHSTVARRYPGRGWTPEQKLAHSFEVKKLNKLLRKIERKNAVAVPHDGFHNPELDLIQRRSAGRTPQHSTDY